MPLIYQFRIYRGDLQANPKVLYVFGDNTRRIGLGGQARHMRGEPNAVGVATKWSPETHAAAYFRDTKSLEIKSIIRNDLKPVVSALITGRTVIWPLEGIGTGLGQLPERAPEIWAWLERVRLHFEETV